MRHALAALAAACLPLAQPAWAQTDTDESSPISALSDMFSRPAKAPPEPLPQPEPDAVFELRVDAALEERIVRPFYTRRATTDGRYSRTQVLWPLWLYERHDKQRRVQLLPLYYYYRDEHRYGDVVDLESDWSVFPLLWGGSSTRDGGYLALFPVGGRLKGLFAKDEIRFVLFPLWFQWRDKGHVSTSWLWPIFGRGSGGGKQTVRVWPLYGRSRKEGWYDRRFYAWPFVYREEFDLRTDTPGRRGMTWPFWTYEYSASREYRSVLWPFFSVENNKRGNYREIAAPFPFFVRRKGNSHKLQLWPFFTGTREGGRETHRVAGPLIQYSKQTAADGVTRSQTTVAWVLRDERIVWPDTGERYQYVRMWPLFNYEAWPSGASRTNVLSPLWFRDARGFEYQYASVYTLYHHERRPDGSRLSWALWNLYRHERTSDTNTWRLWPLAHYARDMTDDTAEFSVLGGALGIRSDPRGRSLRLLWGLDVPLGRRGAGMEPQVVADLHNLPEHIGT